MLLRGPSGAGKSDLAIRALHAGWRLVADDRVRVWRSGGRVFGAAPAPLHGLVEARGQGVLRVAAPAAPAAVVLVADLVAAGDAMERLPDAALVEIAGLPTPRIVLRGSEASALARLALALRANGSPAATPPL